MYINHTALHCTASIYLVIYLLSITGKIMFYVDAPVKPTLNMDKYPVNSTTVVVKQFVCFMATSISKRRKILPRSQLR
jgi:hypothetical protein